MTCPKPTPDPKLSLASLGGEWWQPWGKNALWDRYPCQHIHSNGPQPGNASMYDYTWSYDVFYVNGSLKLLGSTWPIPLAPAGEPIEL